jgi:hypothetical protein
MLSNSKYSYGRLRFAIDFADDSLHPQDWLGLLEELGMI